MQLILFALLLKHDATDMKNYVSNVLADDFDALRKSEGKHRFRFSPSH